MKLPRIIVGVMFAVASAAGVVLPAAAASYGGGSVQGYGAATPIDNGTIVELTGKDNKEVKAVSKADLGKMFGVVVDRGQLPVALSDSSLANETFVAVSGVYNVLVSSENGSINSGDYITLSSLNGIGMKAGTKEDMIFGRANGSFGTSSTVLGRTTLKDTSGATKTVTIGLIPVTINITRNPNIKSTKVDVPQFLQRLGQQIADKQVNPIRIYLSLGITLICLIAAIAVIYAGVRNSVISIGRNPMSKKSIFRALLEVILTALLILIVGLFAVYLLLKL